MTLQPARLLVALFAAAALPVMAQNLAVVNGKPIPSSRADALVKQVTSQSKGRQDTPQLRAMVKDELVTREVLMQEAEKHGTDKTDAVKKQLVELNAALKNEMEMARQSIILQAFVGDFFKKNPVSDADISAEYEKYKAKADVEKEYRARHILVEKEDEAKAIIVKLKGGAKFDDLAKLSKDTGSASKGGDLDWGSPAGYVQAFGDALMSMKKGDLTETPVKTEYGYHVIRVDDVRPAKVQTLEELKGPISDTLQQKKLQALQQELRAKAKIQ